MFKLNCIRAAYNKKKKLVKRLVNHHNNNKNTLLIIKIKNNKSVQKLSVNTKMDSSYADSDNNENNWQLVTSPSNKKHTNSRIVTKFKNIEQSNQNIFSTPNRCSFLIIDDNTNNTDTKITTVNNDIAIKAPSAIFINQL